MIKNGPSSRIILEVERAASDLRRGQPVRLVGCGAHPLRILSGEHAPHSEGIYDPAHPAVRLMKIAGLLPRAVMEETLADNDDGMLSVSAQAIAEYPAMLAASLHKVSEAEVPLAGVTAPARVIAFRPRFGHEEHLAVVIGDPRAQKAPFARIHSACVTGDVFGSLRCDCGGQLHKAIKLIAAQGAGVILYLSQEGRGIGIANKLRAYRLQDGGMDTVEANEALGFAADERDFALAANILQQLELTSVTLITNNPQKIKALEDHGITVAKREKLIVAANAHNERYLAAKEQKLGHKLHDIE